LDTRIVSTILVPARALESQLFVAYANHTGPAFSGTSTVADPYGRRLVTGGDARPELLFADLDHTLVKQARTDVGYLSYFNQQTLQISQEMP
jgi:predicted amidohydrolase